MKDMIEADEFGTLNGVWQWVLDVVRWCLAAAFF